MKKNTEPVIEEKTIKKKPRRKISKRAKSALFWIIFGIYILASLFTVFYFKAKTYAIRLYENVTMEAGTPLEVAPFLIDKDDDAHFVNDAAHVDINMPGDYLIQIIINDYIYNSNLHIVDTTSPVAEATSITRRIDEMPVAASDFIVSSADNSYYDISFANEPDFTLGGTQDISLLVEDISGNSTIVNTTLTILVDEIAPEIHGATDLEYFVGDTIIYRSGITTSDNWDENVDLTIDTSNVNTYEAGEYDVTYIATDDYGNTSSTTITLTLVTKPLGFENIDELNNMIAQLMPSIVTEDMSDIEMVYSIYTWVCSHITYWSTSDHTSYINNAITALNNRAGDCYSYYAISRAMLDFCGIENIEMSKSTSLQGRHWWNLIYLNGEWYHFDSCPRTMLGDVHLLLTDEEISYYSYIDNRHSYDEELYTDINFATTSLQDYIDYFPTRIDLEALEEAGLLTYENTYSENIALYQDLA